MFGRARLARWLCVGWMQLTQQHRTRPSRLTGLVPIFGIVSAQRPNSPAAPQRTTRASARSAYVGVGDRRADAHGADSGSRVGRHCVRARQMQAVGLLGVCNFNASSPFGEPIHPGMRGVQRGEGGWIRRWVATVASSTNSTLMSTESTARAQTRSADGRDRRAPRMGLRLLRADDRPDGTVAACSHYRRREAAAESRR